MASAGKTSADLEVLDPRPGTAVLVLLGEHDLSTKDELCSTLASLLVSHEVVVADLSSVQFVDSSAVGVLVGKVLDWYPTRDEALDDSQLKQPDRLL